MQICFNLNRILHISLGLIHNQLKVPRILEPKFLINSSDKIFDKYYRNHKINKHK